MSVIAESLRRQRLPLLTVAALLLAAGGAWAVVTTTAPDRLSQPAFPVAAPEIQQAKWKIDYTAQGRFGGLTKAQRERYSTQKEKVTGLITGIYDGIFLKPAQLDQVLKTSFSNDAAHSLEARKLSFPNGATDVKTTRRKADIGLDAQKADFAVGRVTIVATADVDAKPLKIKHRSTLWLERSDEGWKVIAFDVEHGPVK